MGTNLNSFRIRKLSPNGTIHDLELEEDFLENFTAIIQAYAEGYQSSFSTIFAVFGEKMNNDSRGIREYVLNKAPLPHKAHGSCGNKDKDIQVCQDLNNF